MDINLLHGDCLELMKDIPENSIDLTVTSPPYDNLRSYNGNNDKWNASVWKSVITDLFRITKDGGVVVWVVNDATIKGSETGTSFRQALHFMDCGFNLHDTMIYQKDACPFPETNRYYPSFEYMFILSKGKPKTTNLIMDKPNKRFGEKITGTGRNPDGTLKPHIAVKNKTNRVVKEFGVRTNVWLYSVGKWKITKDEYAYEHPAMFPEQLAQDHIITWSNPGDIVFDPFMGSGTTGKMAVLNGRKFIGVELDDEYFEIAKRRISEARNKPEQMTLDEVMAKTW
jgi:site-specific DNA-methyltransferase (adenine-specific)